MKTLIKRLKKGFTITELVIVIAVIAILAAVLIPTFANVIENANESAAMQECRSEWSNYQPEVATEPTEGNDFLITTKGYCFIVEDGQFNSEALEGVTVPNDTTVNWGDSEKGDVYSTDITKIADTDYVYANSNVVIYRLSAAAGN